MQVKVLQNAPREHSAILSTFIKLQFVVKYFVLPIVSGRFKQALLYSVENREYVFKCNITLFLQENLICGQEFARANANMILMGGVLVGALAIGILADM